MTPGLGELYCELLLDSICEYCSGVSSFNQFIHELSVYSDTTSSVDYSYGEDYSDEDDSPSTQLLQSSRVSRAGSFGRHDRHWGLWARCFRCMFTWILFPARFLMGILLYIYRASLFRGSKVATTSGNLQPSDSDTTKKADTLKDHVVQRATNRRRGLTEDPHLGIEICIEAIFDVVHKATRCLISPLDTSRALLRWFSFRRSKDIPHSASDASVPTATLGEIDPTPTERPVTFRDSLNTDGRTCRDVITELGSNGGGWRIKDCPLVRAYDGWNDAEKRQAGYEYCCRNFLFAQTLRAIDSPDIENLL